MAALGALFYFGGRLPFRLGRLPGDITVRGGHTTFYFPIVTCIVISVALTFLFWIIGPFPRWSAMPPFQLNLPPQRQILSVTQLTPRIPALFTPEFHGNLVPGG